MYGFACYSRLIFPRYTKPLPESLIQQAKEELFNGDLTEEESEEKHP